MTIADRMAEIRSRMDAAARKAGRDPQSVRLLAVSKTKPQDLIREAYAAGQRDFGENYIQEGVEKAEQISAEKIQWHFIGHLQRNKAKFAVPHFHLIHSVDSLKLVAEIQKQAAKHDKIQDILIQVNMGGETSKSGVTPETTLDFITSASAFQNVRIRGLMTIPPPVATPEDNRPHFRETRNLLEAANALEIPGLFLDTLSMGMTDDFEVAIEEGATWVRVGTAIFGARGVR